MAKPRELTLKRQKLVKVFPTASSKAEAGRLAGYQGNVKAVVSSVSDALENPRVQAALKAEVASLAEKSGVTPEWALKHLKANVERSMQAVPVTNAEGNEIGVWQYQPAAVNKGVELALRFNKLLGDDKQPETPPVSPVTQQILVLMGDETVRQAMETLARRMEELRDASKG